MCTQTKYDFRNIKRTFESLPSGTLSVKILGKRVKREEIDLKDAQPQ